MEFRLLGPFEVVARDGPLTIPGRRQRSLLAMLVLHAGTVVSTGRLIDAVWGDERRADPKNTLQSQISQLRRAFGAVGHRDVIVSKPPGYQLDVEAERVDAVRFERLVEEGRAALAGGDPARAGDRLREGLALWRGPVLAEFDDHEFARATITRLEELRLVALETRIEADLGTGRHAELIGELENLVAAHPLRERLRGQLMLAMYRAGRQADALEVFHDARRVLDEELGLDPSPELQRRYEAVLRQDDEAPPHAVPAAPATGGRRPPAAAPGNVPGNVPTPLSSFVGRDDELERVVDLIRAGRLVTLTGPGGVGKTRLATEAALRLRDRGDARDGVWIVELADLVDAGELVVAVAEVLGLRDETGVGAPAGAAPRDAEARLSAALRDKRAVVVLDNCEHLVDAVATLARGLLAGAPELTLVCTSREALGITGETVWSVPSLEVPADGAGQQDPDELLRHGAARLFVERVENADPRFSLDAAAVPLVADVCRRLDGIPLALELAAARSRTLGLRELAARLDDRFRILAAGDRTAQPRQRTLRAVVEWSWDLLDARERVLFRRLSVFAGGATLAGVEAVCADPDTLPATEVVDVLARLVDKSLVVSDHGADPARFRMLETLRAFAAERLDEEAEAMAVRRRHARHCLDLVRDLAPRLRSGAQLDANRRLDDDLDNLRAALRRSAEAGDVGTGARLAGGLGWYWYVRGHRPEGVRWLDAFRDPPEPRDRAVVTVWREFLAVEGVPTAGACHAVEDAAAVLREHGSADEQAVAELVAANLTLVVGDAGAAAAHLGAAREAADRAGDEVLTATADFLEGAGHLGVADFQRGRQLMEAALDRFARAGDRWGQVQCLIALVTVAEGAGDIERAVAFAEDGLRLARELGMGELEAFLHTRRANLAVLAGDLPRAESAVAHARRLASELGADFVAAHADNAEGFAAARAGDLAAAERAHERALAWFRRVDMPAGVAYSLGRLGYVAERAGDLDRAAALHLEGHGQAAASGDPRAVAFALEGLAGTLAAGGRAEDAAVLLGAAAAQRESVHLPLPDVERTDVGRARTAAVAAVGEHRFADAFERGRAADPSTVLAAVRDTP